MFKKQYQDMMNNIHVDESLNEAIRNYSKSSKIKVLQLVTSMMIILLAVFGGIKLLSNQSMDGSNIINNINNSAYDSNQELNEAQNDAYDVIYEFPTKEVNEYLLSDGYMMTVTIEQVSTVSQEVIKTTKDNNVIATMIIDHQQYQISVPQHHESSLDTMIEIIYGGQQ